MRIAIEAKAVVTDMRRGVACLSHRADSEHRQHILLGLTLDISEQRIEALSDDGASALDLELVAEATHVVGETSELFLIGSLVDTVDEGRLTATPQAKGRADILASRLGYTLGDRAVRQQHEFLNELVSGLTLLDIYREGLALFVQLEADFGAVKGDTPDLEATCTELLREAMERQDSLCMVALPRLDDLLRLLIGEAALATDDGAGDTCRAELRVFVQREDTAVGILILVGAERAEEVAQALGEHRYRTVHEVDTGSTLVGLIIDETTRLDIVADVGDMHPDFIAPFRKRAEGEGVVEVLRITRVDGAGQHPTEVLTLCELLFGDLGRECFGSLLYGLGIAIGEAELSEDGMHLRRVIAGLTEDIDDFPARVLALAIPVGDAYDDLIMARRTHGLILGDEDILA